MNKGWSQTITGPAVRRIITKCQVEGLYQRTMDAETCVECLALWDTGSEGTVVSERIVKELDLEPYGKSLIGHLNGRSTSVDYLVELILPSGQRSGLLRVNSGTIPSEVDVIIGMDVISRGDFQLLQKDGGMSFSFNLS